ncbi:HAD family hydrolase [Nocardia amamiensis]|uniref:HAD family hydrolase n=1 Tax=Nocardia amamiensis TaxID=404578 RepID=UPI0008377C31|nr:HAD family phosphatase [Nocardia amamiensis]
MPVLPGDVGALIVDFDGTLADTSADHEQALREALQPYSIDLSHQWYRDHIGLSIRDLLSQLPGAGHLPHEQIIRWSRTRLLASVHAITPITCVVTLVHAARRAGLPCAVASGASRVLVGPGLKALGLAGEFATVVAREDVAHGKPAPDLFAEAASRLGVAPRVCLAVDDAPEGVASARAAGMRVLTVIEGHLALLEDGSEAAANDGMPQHRHDQHTPPHDGTRPPDQGA